MGHTAFTEPQCLHKGDLYLYLLFLYKIINFKNSFRFLQQQVKSNNSFTPNLVF